MAYHVEINQSLVLNYLFGDYLDFSEGDIGRILRFLEVEVGQTGDRYAGDATRRIASGSPHFLVYLIFLDSRGKVWHFRFIISDAKSSYGILSVRYADEAPDRASADRP